MVIDHPHVGDITAQHCLIPLDIAERETECSALAANSVGPSWSSYEWRARQWALPIELDRGGVLTVVRQNLETSSAQAHEERGRRVVLNWRPDQAYTIESTERTEEDT